VPVTSYTDLSVGELIRALDTVDAGGSPRLPDTEALVDRIVESLANTVQRTGKVDALVKACQGVADDCSRAKAEIVVTSLIAALARAELAPYAEDALVRIGSTGVPSLTEALGNIHPELRHRAACALGRIGPDAIDALPALILSLREVVPHGGGGILTFAHSHDINGHAINALGRIGEGAVPGLTKALANPDVRIRRGATLALLTMTPEHARCAVTALVDALGDRDQDVRCGAIDALGGLGPMAASAVPALLAALTAPSPVVRRAVVHSIGRIREDGLSAMAALGVASRDSDEGVRSCAIGALEAIGGDSAVHLLIKATRDTTDRVASQVVAALGSLAALPQLTIPTIIAAMRTTGDTQGAAVKALGQFGADAVTSVVALLHDADPDVRVAALRAVAQLKEHASDAVPALIQALSDPDPAVRSQAVWALEKFDGDATRTIEAITDALKDEDSWVRMAAAMSLATFGSAASAAIPVLVTLLDSGLESPDGYAASFALRTIGEAVIPPLLEALRAASPRLRSGAVYVLASYRGSATEAALIDMLDDQEAEVRLQAAVPLRWWGDDVREKVPLRWRAFVSTARFNDGPGS
jgi:HEAT repeat protein